MYGRCVDCHARTTLAFQPGVEPPRPVCINCYQPLPSTHAPAVPMLDEYITAAHGLAVVVRDALDHPGQVRKGELRKVLEAFERVDMQAERSKD